MEVSSTDVLKEMLLLANIGQTNIQNEIEIRRLLRSMFGFDAEVVALVWNMLEQRKVLVSGAKIKYLLYMCCFLKTYLTYDQYRVMFGVSYPTFKSWVWYFAGHISKLDVVSGS
jgi:hypothetical protein